MNALLKVSGLCKHYGGVEALRDVSFDVLAGETVAMIGPNGAGKTTCFNIINGQVAPDSGSVSLDGQRADNLSPSQRWRLGVGRTFQIAATFSSMTVRENVQLALLSHARKLGSFLRRADSAFVSEAEQLLTVVGLIEQASRPCSVLAYGDIKRLELAIALSNAPKLLLMDEPTAGMGSKERSAMMTFVTHHAQAQAMAVLFVEHDMEAVFTHANRIIVLHQGLLIANGPPQAVASDPKVREVYLGSTDVRQPMSHA